MKPIAAMAETTVQQHDRRAGAVTREANARAVAFDPAIAIGVRQLGRAVGREAREIVVAGNHTCLAMSAAKRSIVDIKRAFGSTPLYIHAKIQFTGRRVRIASSCRRTVSTVPTNASPSSII